jgi:hypothetical protein
LVLALWERKKPQRHPAAAAWLSCPGSEAKWTLAAIIGALFARPLAPSVDQVKLAATIGRKTIDGAEESRARAHKGSSQ